MTARHQIEYSLAERSPDQDLVPFAATNDRLIIAYSPLAQGFRAAKYDASNRPDGVRLTNPLFLEENLTRGHDLLNTLRSVAKAHGATPAQVALAWVIRRPNVVAIPGASSVDQLVGNAEAADLDLSDSENAELNDASDQFEPLTGVAASPAWFRSRLSSAANANEARADRARPRCPQSDETAAGAVTASTRLMWLARAVAWEEWRPCPTRQTL